ncbi:MAG: ribulose-phosphate 3-epimerase [Chloroflexota bacterium]|nr:ribulose-phosphate 3-epimerase [Chloroflexota bacterium]
MNSNYLIAPSILSADFTKLGSQITQAEKAGAGWIHVDVMDGHFVPNLTMGPFIVEACARVTDLPLDVHLMVEKPETFLEAFALAGASSLTVHVETYSNVRRTIQTIRQLGCKAGIALSPDTPASAIVPIIPLVDLVLVMSVNPGYSGQKFIPEIVPKIVQIRKMLNETNSQAIIEVDGGITAQTLPLALNAGAQAFVAASAIFKHPQGIEAGIRALRKQLPN